MSSVFEHGEYLACLGCRLMKTDVIIWEAHAGLSPLIQKGKKLKRSNYKQASAYLHTWVNSCAQLRSMCYLKADIPSEK